MLKTVISLEKISKKFLVHHEKPTLIESMLRRKTKENFWALKNINLSIKKGELVGIMGANGSGKTTLLEIIGGIAIATAGKLMINGKIVSIIDLEAGFHSDLTGEENILLNGLLVGMSKKEIKSRLKKIINFADIGNFIDSPFYTYSSGMKLRLSFSIAVHADPDILILDETLSIGDQNFREKAYKKIKEFYNKRKTVIIVSHEMDLIRSACERVILIKNGRIIKDGEVKKIMKLIDKGFDL